MTTVAQPVSEIAAALQPERWSRAEGGIVVLGALCTLVTVGRPSFDLDESVSASLAVAPWHAFTQTVVHREANMALYYAVLRAWVVFGRSEVALRALSVLAALAALVVVMVLVRRLFDRRTALVCGLLLAVDPLLVLFAQDARGYALSLALVAASSALFVHGIENDAGPWWWVAYAVVSALAAYTNFWAALVPLSHAISLSLRGGRPLPWRRLVPTAVGLVVALIPLGLLIHATDAAGVNWAAGSSAGKVFTDVRAHVPHAVIDLAVVVVVAVVTAAVAIGRRHRRSAAIFAAVSRAWPLAFVVCWLVVPVAAVVLLSLVYKPLLVVRYLVVCLPPAIIVVALAIRRLRRRAGTVVLVAAVVVSGIGVGALYAHGSFQDWRGAATTVADGARRGDGVVVFAPYVRTPFQWYLGQHRAAERLLAPLEPAGPWRSDGLGFDRTPAVTAAAITAAVAGHRRVWLVLSQEGLFPSQYRAVLGGLAAAGLTAQATTALHGVEVVRYG